MTKQRDVKVVTRKRKVNKKDQAKNEVMAIIEKALEQNGVNFKDGVDFGMTNGTIVVEHKDADVQIKPISPRAGIERYREVEIRYE